MEINKLVFFVLILFISNSFSQDSKPSFDELDPLSPSKAAFYSAVFPGAGQAFNKKYWKIPIVYAAIGTSIYSYNFNQKKYWNYRNAYKSRKAGYSNDEFQNLILDDNRLLDGADFHKKNRDLALLSTVLFYILNIVEANVSAHLAQFNVNKNLSLNPNIYQDEFTFQPKVGVTFNYHF